MEEGKIFELIEELKCLRIREAIVLAELEAVNKKRVERDSRKPRGTQDRNRPAIDIVRGDRVYVNNRVKKPSSGWINPENGEEWTASKERHATVTRVTGDRVYIVTDNGVHTWRASKNLGKITTL